LNRIPARMRIPITENINVMPVVVDMALKIVD
jgi:hypothetical protein